MVATRSSRRTPAPEDDGSNPSDGDILALPVRRRGAIAQTPATLPPRAESASTDFNLAKKKRTISAEPSIRKAKRRREGYDEAKESIEVGAEDGDKDDKEDEEDDEHVDGAVIDMMNAASKPRPSRAGPACNIQVVLRTSGSRARRTAAPETLPTGTSERRPRAKRLGRHKNALEIIDPLGIPGSQRTGRMPRPSGIVEETPQPQQRSRPVQSAGSEVERGTEAWEEEQENEDEVRSGFEHSTTLLGSPELQSSAAKPRALRAAPDVYDVPEVSQHSTSVAHRGRKTINGLGSLVRVQKSEAPARRPPVARNGARLSSIHEVEAPGSDSHGPLFIIDDFESEPLEESGGEGEESDSNESEPAGRAASPPATQMSGFVAIQVRPHTGRTMTVSHRHVKNMEDCIGLPGWTGLGQGWADALLRFVDPDFDEDSDEDFDEVFDEDLYKERPARTLVGNRCFRSLSSLMVLLDDMPDANDLPKQTSSLAKAEQRLNKVMASLDRVTAKICDEGAIAGSRRRAALAHDLASSIIPMLVLVLSSAFALGFRDTEEQSDLLPKEGLFTWSTIQYILWTTDWLCRLQTVLMSIQGTDEANASRQSRERFGTILGKWKEHLRHAVDEYNKLVDDDRDRQRKKQRDEAIRETSRRAEEDDLARSQRQYANWELSIKRFLSQPRPLAEKWRKATLNWNVPPPPSLPPPPRSSSQVNGIGNLRTAISHSGLGSSSGTQPRAVSSSSPSRLPPAPPGPRLASHPPAMVIDLTRDEDDGCLRSGAQPRAFSKSSSWLPPAPSRPQPASPPAVQLDLNWDEGEVEWFLRQLHSPHRKSSYLHEYAEVLERPLDEVRKMEEQLKRTGRYRSLGR